MRTTKAGSQYHARYVVWNYPGGADDPANARYHMMSNLTNKTDADLRMNLQQSREMLASLIESLNDRPDMQNAVRRLMSPDDMLETFAELAVKEPDLMRLVLQVSVAALVNVQSVNAVEAEMKRRAVKGN
jgi:hypothetical protein